MSDLSKLTNFTLYGPSSGGLLSNMAHNSLWFTAGVVTGPVAVAAAKKAVKKFSSSPEQQRQALLSKPLTD
jgi:hypothetical protein